MFVVESAATYPHAPDVVFAALASVEGALRWRSGVRGVRRAGAPEGRRGVVVAYHALGERHPLVTRITACDPPRQFAYRGVGGEFTLEVVLTLEPSTHHGGTRVTYRLSLDAAPTAADGAAERALAPLRRLLARRVPRDLERLRRYVGLRALAVTGESIATAPGAAARATHAGVVDEAGAAVGALEARLPSPVGAAEGARALTS